MFTRQTAHLQFHKLYEEGNHRGIIELILSLPEEQLNDDIYVRAQYNNNQVGDFLDHVEIEQKYQNILKKYLN